MRGKLLQHALMGGVLRCCSWSGLDWQRLFLICALFTLVGIFIPNYLFFFPQRFDQLVSYHVESNNRMPQRVSSLPADEARIAQFNNASQNNNNSDQPPSMTKLNFTIPTSSNGGGKSRVAITRNKQRKKKTKVIDDVLKFVLPPPRAPISPRLKRYVWSLSPIDALSYAKKEIEKAPLIIDDPYLHGPIFRNISIFKRSYDLMEMILKVYIYPDGKRPIFHQPHLSGIYASEGWFMKFIKENKKFTTRDPEKAHLFYLPYSARQLELALYVPHSHNLRPLSIFMRDYANMIAGKYPFWNRTHGHDHFLVACHDWGPYTLTMHEELTKNTIKALCNADVSEGIFSADKDVSLPETTIRIPRRPLRNVGGGMRVSKRPILAFFAGNMHGRVRPMLLRFWHNKDEEMKIYGPLPTRISRKLSYVQHMKSSKYCICPMGYEVNSPRIVEAIYYECVPVIIADNFVLPFSEVLDWSTFSVVVLEKDIPKLKEILLAIPMRRYLTMLANLKMVQKHFLWNPRPIRYDLFHMILHSIWFSRINKFQVL